MSETERGSYAINSTEELKEIFGQLWHEIADEQVRWDIYLMAMPTGQVGPGGEMQAVTMACHYGEIRGAALNTPVHGTWIGPVVGLADPELARRHVRDMFAELVRARSGQLDQMKRDAAANKDQPPTTGLIRPGDYANPPDDVAEAVESFSRRG